MFRTFFRFHLIPLFIALILTSGVVFLVSNINHVDQITEQINIKGVQKKQRGRYSNLLIGDQAEIDLFASLKKTDQLTIFGSSELSESELISYHFLPDSMGIPALALGHAYHQNLSILIELLAGKEFLKKSDICIILSPGWFETRGTNVEAFIEVARPNLLNKIWEDSTISNEFKCRIGQYIHNKYYDINGVTGTMDRFVDLYLKTNGNIWDKQLLSLKNTVIPFRKKVISTYDITLKQDSFVDSGHRNFTKKKQQLQKDFLDRITNNNIYVNNHYFSTYLEEKDGSFKMREINHVELVGSEEYTDFLLVLQLLKENQANVSFILQPYNPYFYKGTAEYKSVMDHLAQDIESHGFPYLNMYVADKKDYEPATLKDVMHLGEYGWMTINEFLISIYHD